LFQRFNFADKGARDVFPHRQQLEVSVQCMGYKANEATNKTTRDRPENLCLSKVRLDPNHRCISPLNAGVKPSMVYTLCINNNISFHGYA
jgi:hypothetical protein